ncbi:MAG TPA: hypothetical protein VGD26_03420, partial [Chitinophagaceae bacterium]
MQVKLTEEDLNTLYGTETHLWARLCMYALQRAYRGESPAHVFSRDDLYFSCDHKDLLNLKTFGYIDFDSANNGRILTLLKYEANHPTTE